MTDQDKELLEKLERGIISADTLLENFSADIKSDTDFVKAAVIKAMTTGDQAEVDKTIQLIWLSGNISRYVDVLNKLLIHPHHSNHQLVARKLQTQAPDPTTVPFVRKALESRFDYLAYTGSETDAIAKWFSWLLSAINTKEAMDLMKKYSSSGDEGIRYEMQYRLGKC